MQSAILDVKVTPNRPDCLCMIGIAREVAALTRAKVHLPEARYEEHEPSAEEGIRLATNLRRFKGPWRFGVDKGSRRSGALVVTSRRLVGFSRSRTAINIPWEHPSFGKLRIEVESPSVLLIAYEAQHFIPDTTGTIELRFRLRDPAAFLAAIATARGARN